MARLDIINASVLLKKSKKHFAKKNNNNILSAKGQLHIFLSYLISGMLLDLDIFIVEFY